MANPVCILTGAGRGIGRATAIELGRRGYDVALVGRSRDALDAVSAELPTDSLVLPADVVEPDAVADAVAQALERYGRVDAVVHCAGLAPALSVDQTDPATWRAVIDTNLSGAFYLARAAWAALGASGGAIVNVGSEASRDPLPGFAAYASAKAGLSMLTQVLHREGRPLGVRAYCVAPAAVETGMFRALVSEAKYPSSLTLDPADVARAIVGCIAGDLRHASGETIYVHKT